MKKPIIVLVILLVAISIFSQTPEWVWASQIQGDSDSNEVVGITTDQDNNSYVFGNYCGTIIIGSITLNSTGLNAFIAKINADGNCLWVKEIVGSNIQGQAISTDCYGNSYVAGKFVCNTVMFGSIILTSTEYHNLFIAKIDAEGVWQWALQAEVDFYFECNGISNDIDGNAYLTGRFSDTLILGIYTQIISVGNYDVFVAKIDTNGNWLWAVQAGGIVDDTGRGICTNSNGISYITGEFRGTAQFGPHTIISWDNCDIFVAKIDTNGNWLWAVRAGGYNVSAIGTDAEGNGYVTGNFTDTVVIGLVSFTSIGESDIYIAKCDTDGIWLWASQAGGNLYDKSNSMSVDAFGNCYVTGNFEETSNFGSITLTSYGSGDIFVAKMDSNGNWLWVTQAGGTGYDQGKGISIDQNENIYVAGEFFYLASFGSHYLSSYGPQDIFEAKLGNDTSVERKLIPLEMNLSNYPNPFNPITTIEFSIQNNSKVELSIYNIKGQKIKTLANNDFTKGSHSIIWNGDDEIRNSVSSGVYFYKLSVNGKTEAVKKCILLK